ncbi:MAG: glycoside hydrolase family 104 protein [Prochlorococcaceae cyanobacterium]
MLRSFRGWLNTPDPGSLCSTALLLAMPLPLLDQVLPSQAGPRPQGAISRPVAAKPVTTSPKAQPVAALPYALTPERRALLNTIRYAEGTWKGGDIAGYRILYGGSQFASLERHPRIVVTNRYTSAAAGAYQFLPSTWDEVSARLRLRDFSPTSQDQAALHLSERRGALADLERHGLSRSVMARLAYEWASFPTASGASYYGQPVKRADDLRNFYEANLLKQRQRPA